MNRTRELARRDFVQFLAASPLLAAWGCSSQSSGPVDAIPSLDQVKNLADLSRIAAQTMGHDSFGYLEGGAEDERTLALNESIFSDVGIRCRRLIDVSTIDTKIRLFGEEFASPIGVCPVGFQGIWHDEGELAMGRATASLNHMMMLSTASTYSVGEVTSARGSAPWFQLYPTTSREVARKLLERVSEAGSPVIVLTIDTPIIGNRERHGDYLRQLLTGGPLRMGNYEGIRNGEPISDPSMTWEMIGWIKEHCPKPVVLKGIVTREDAELACEHGADGLLVSNHGGRQEESDRSTLECLPEVVEAAAGRVPVLLDGGVRRGTDVFKALALGADAIAVGRPSIWGLAANGQPGIELALGILQRELVSIMQLAGTVSLADITPDHVEWRGSSRG